MGSVVQLKKQITNAYTDLLNSVDIKTIWQEDDNFICSEKWIIS